MRLKCDYLVVGAGIVGRHLAYSLGDLGNTLCLDSPFAPSTSSSSTALNSLRGAQRGVSPLGDLLVDGYDSFKQFNSTHSPAGIGQCLEYQLWSTDSPTKDKWHRRYSRFETIDALEELELKLPQLMEFKQVELFTINPKKLFAWYDDCLKYRLHYGHLTSVDLSTKTGRLEDGTCIDFEKIIFATNYLSLGLQAIFNNPELTKQKPNPGNYLELKLKKQIGLNLKKSFCLSLEFDRLIYRKDDETLMFSTKDPGMTLIPDQQQLNDSYKRFKAVLGLRELPPFNEFRIVKALRMKGHRRMPRLFMTKDAYAISGVHKNGYTFAYYFADQLKRLFQGSDHQ